MGYIQEKLAEEDQTVKGVTLRSKTTRPQLPRALVMVPRDGPIGAHVRF